MAQLHAQEQERAEQLFREHGPNYAEIAERMITRTPNQMRVYFQRRGRHLVDGEEPRRSTPWTPSEKRLIILRQQRLFNKWTAIARELPGRTAQQVESHWRTRLKKQYDDLTSRSRNLDGRENWGAESPSELRQRFLDKFETHTFDFDKACSISFLRPKHTCWKPLNQ